MIVLHQAQDAYTRKTLDLYCYVQTIDGKLF